MTRVRRALKLHPTQDAFMSSEAPIRGFLGGRASGNSLVGALDLICRARPDRLYLVASPTYTMLADTTLRTLARLGRELCVIGPGALKTTPPPSLRLSIGAEVVFRSTENPDRLRGPNYSGAWLDEAGLMPREVYDIVLPALREGGERGWLSVTMTPKGLSHWTYDVFGKPGPGVETFHAPTRANPFLPPDFAHDIRVQYGEGLRAAQELDGRFVNVSGAEWPEDYFGEQIWFTDWPDRATIVRSVLAIDGSKGRLKGDRQALVLLRLDRDGRFWIDAEAHRLDEFALLAKAVELIERWRPDVTVVETNGAGYYLQGQLARARIHGISPAVVGRHHGAETHKHPRIATRLTSQWAQGHLRLRRGSPGCRLLVQEARDFPEGEYDDLLDALEMGMELLGELVRPRAERIVCYEMRRG